MRRPLTASFYSEPPTGSLPMSSLAVARLAPSTARPLRILFLVSAHNSLSQRTQVALTELGHHISVAVVATPEDMESSLERV